MFLWLRSSRGQWIKPISNYLSRDALSSTLHNRSGASGYINGSSPNLITSPSLTRCYSDINESKENHPRPRKSPPFTDAEIEQAIAMRKDGIPIEQIATRLNRSSNSMHHLIYRNIETRHLFPLSNPGRVFKPAEVDLLMRLREKGLPWKAIQKNYFPDELLSKLSVGYHVALHKKTTRRNFFNKNGNPYSGTEDLEIRRLREELRWEWHEIGYHLRRTPRSVEQRYARIRSAPDSVQISRFGDLQPTEAEVAEIVRLRDLQGLTFGAISSAIGGTVSRWQVSSLYKKAKRAQNRGDSSLASAHTTNSNSRHLPWTASEDAKLLQLAESNLTIVQMEDHVPGRSIQAIRMRLKRLLQTVPPTRTWFFTPEEDKSVLRMRDEEGRTWAEIAEVLGGRSYESVRGRYRRLVMTSSVANT